MNRKLVRFAAILSCMVVSGCTVCENLKRTMKYEPDAFSWKHDRPRSTEAYERLAEQVWGEESANCAEMAEERDYYLGFRDGFVDYIWAGGSGEPPPVPPRYLWNVMLRSPEGKQRADLWFDGYRHGAGVARSGGYRELGTIRTSLVGLAHNPNEAGYPEDGSGPRLYDPNEPVPPEQILPEPPAAQALPARDLPTRVTASAAAAHAPLQKPKAPPISPAPVARPAQKQPAAFEALGLALLPTDPPTTMATRNSAAHAENRPARRTTKPAIPFRARYQRDTGHNGAVSAPEQQTTKRKLPVTTRPNTAANERIFATDIANELVRDIVLKPSRGTEKVVAAGHSEPTGMKRTHTATQANGISETSANSAARTVVSAAAVTAVPNEPSIGEVEVIPASHAEPVAPKADEPTLRLASTASTAGDSPAPDVRFLKTISGPTCEPSAAADSNSGATTSPKIRIPAGNDEQVQRIVIAAPAVTSNAVDAAVNPQSSTATIRIRTATEEVERLPVKGAGSLGRATNR
jgi:hypothetical protein